MPSPADAVTLVRATSGATLLALVACGGRDGAGPSRRIAFALLLGAVASDWVDGPLARRDGPSRLGAVLDIEADSLLTLGGAAAATAWGGLPRGLPANLPADSVAIRAIGRRHPADTASTHFSPDGALGGKHQEKVRDLPLAPVDDAEEATRRDLADLVPDKARDERRLGVVQHDAFAAIEPARLFVDGGPDGPDPERRDLVAQPAAFRIEDLSLPGQQPDKRGERSRHRTPRHDDRGPNRVAARNAAYLAADEQLIERGLRHPGQGGRVNGHGYGHGTSPSN